MLLDFLNLRHYQHTNTHTHAHTHTYAEEGKDGGRERLIASEREKEGRREGGRESHCYAVLPTSRDMSYPTAL